MSEDFPIIEYSRSIGKTTDKLTFWDMISFYGWMQKGNKEVMSKSLKVKYNGRRLDRKEERR